MQRFLLAAAAVLVAGTPSGAQQQEVIYVTPNTGKFINLHAYDLESGALLTTQEYEIPDEASSISSSLTYDGKNLLARSHNVVYNELYGIHPAGARTFYVGDSTFRWTWATYAFNPADGELYALTYHFLIEDVKLARIDQVTGRATIIGVLDDLEMFGPTGLAFSSDGIAYISSRLGGSRIFELDLQALTYTQVAQFQLNGGYFTDIAVDSKDRIWASVYDAVTGAESGVHRLDMATGTATQVVFYSGEQRLTGVAIAPGCFGKVYCTAKTNSLGCLPEIVSWGQASPSTDRGFELSASNVRNNMFGALLYSTAGPAAVPFQGGTLCVDRRYEVAAGQSSGGTPAPTIDCSGEWLVDFNTYLHKRHPFRASAGSQPVLTPGTMLYAQWIGRDGGEVTLTDAVQIEICQ